MFKEMQEFGKIIQFYRNSSTPPRTLEDVAKACDVTKATIYNIENGAEPHLGLALKLVNELKIPHDLVFPNSLTKLKMDELIDHQNFNPTNKENRKILGVDGHLEIYFLKTSHDSSSISRGRRVGYFYYFCAKGVLTFEFSDARHSFDEGNILKFPAFLECRVGILNDGFAFCIFVHP